MSKFLRLSGGVARQFAESGAAPIYDETILIVASSPSAGQSLPITAGTPITLPSSQTYEGIELQVFFNGNYVEDVIDYILLNSTQIQFNQDLVVGDRLRFRIDRLPEV